MKAKKMTRIKVFGGVLAFVVMINGGAPRTIGIPPVATAAARLDTLRGVDELKTLFNRDAGKVRLVLLVSPT